MFSENTYLPIYLTEYNISHQGSPRVQSYQGAVYDALILTESISAGADASLYWAMAPYSDMSLLDGDTRTGSSYLYEIFNQSFHGDLVSSQSQQAKKVTSYAVFNKTRSVHSFSLINRTAKPQRVKLYFEHWLPSKLSWNLWDAENDFIQRETSWVELGKGDFVLSPYSVNVFVE